MRHLVMKIIVVGGSGTIGKAVVSALSKKHTVVTVGHSKGDVCVDITDAESIHAMYQSVGNFDALISTTGKVSFCALTEFTHDQYSYGLQNKLMGQVNLVLIGLKYISQAGSFTLTSGVLSHDPIRLGSSAAMVNGAIDAFVKSAAIEMPEQLRINAVSPTVITESMDKYADYFRGFESVSASRVALAYCKSVEGMQTGQVYRVW